MAKRITFVVRGVPGEDTWVIDKNGREVTVTASPRSVLGEDATDAIMNYRSITNCPNTVKLTVDSDPARDEPVPVVEFADEDEDE